MNTHRLPILFASLLAGSQTLNAVDANRESKVEIPNVRFSPRPAWVSGVDQPVVSLNGAWQYILNAATNFPAQTVPSNEWKNVNLPWSIFGGSMGYRRAFTVPPQWKGQRIKLQFETVEGNAGVFVNGKEVRNHDAQFLPFETDITDALTPDGEQVVAVRVTPHKYKFWANGGISGNITLFALPPVHLARFHTETTFDAGFKDATLRTFVTIANEGAAPADRPEVVFTLADAEGKPVPLGDAAKVTLPVVAPGQNAERTVEIPVASPRHWDMEHPYLYTLTAELRQNGKVVQRGTRRVGFRQITFADNVLLVNGQMVRLRGAVVHRVHMTRGYAWGDETWRNMARTLRDTNLNALRVNPAPSESFLDACDELGLLVECAVPISFVRPSAEKAKDFTLMTAELIEAHRSHPAIFTWELANESNWGPAFDMSGRAAKSLDPSRPIMNARDNGPIVDLLSGHYPGIPGGLTRAEFVAPTNIPPWAAALPALPKLPKRQYIYSEYCHINCYNLAETRTDPGLRDHWGWAMVNHYERTVYGNPQTLCGMVFSGNDYIDAGMYGNMPWGFLDAWQRPKPEHWHVRKTHSPTRVFQTEIKRPPAGTPLRIEVHNRNDFSDLSEIAIEWSAAGKTGKVTASGKPHKIGVIEIADPAVAKADALELRFTSPRGFTIDEYRLPITDGVAPVAPAPAKTAGAAVLEQDATVYRVRAGKTVWEFDKTTGLIRNGAVDGVTVVTGGPFPVCSGELTDWQPQAVEAKTDGAGVVLVLRGSFANGKTDKAKVAVDGSCRLRVTGVGALQVAYEWSPVAPAKLTSRELGMGFVVSRTCDTLSWKRRGLWSVYPNDHIGRLEGRALAFRDPSGKADDPKQQPTWPFSQDQTENGTADFRGTKHNILQAALTTAGGIGLRVDSDGSQHTRSYVSGDAIRLLILHHSGNGGDTFSGKDIRDNPTLDAKSRIEGTTTLRLVNEKPSDGAL